MKKIVCLMLVVILSIELSVIPASAATFDEDSGTYMETEIALPDLGIKLNHVTAEDANRIDMIAEEITELANSYDAILKMQSEIEDQSLYISLEETRKKYYVLQDELQKLGAVKLTDEQKIAYINGIQSQSAASVAKSSIPGIDYPDIYGIDFYIYEYTVTLGSGKGTYQMARCIATHTPDTQSKMMQSVDGIDMYLGISLTDLKQKTIRYTVENMTSNALASLVGNKATFVAGLLWELADSQFSTIKTSSVEKLSLSVSTVSSVVHYWVKVNGTYYFRLSTCAAQVRESWLLIDVNGNHFYTPNSFWVFSPYYNSGDELAVSTNVYLAYGINLAYETQSSTGWNVTKNIAPFTASLPINFLDN